MATTSSVVAALGLAVVLRGLSPIVVQVALPTAWTHTLAPSNCQWHATPWAQRLGALPDPRYSPTNEQAWHACERNRGLKSVLPVLKTVLARFPTSAELAAMSRQDNEDENRSPLLAEGPPAAGDVRSHPPG